MLIIINDDPAYVSWLSRHRQGYVVDSKRRPTKNHLILHRATCPVVKPHKKCQPDVDEPATGEHQVEHSLTRLGREILSYVLDLAVMYLDGEERHYHPKVQDIAVYLAKSPAQIMPALQRLVAEDYLDCEPPTTNGALPAASIIYPTAAAL
jgi:hypothetical protein